MTKYSIKFTEIVAQELINGHSSAPELARKCGVTNCNSIYKWRDEFIQTGGINQYTKNKSSNYTPEYVLNVVKYTIDNKLTLMESVTHFNTFSQYALHTWLKIYEEQGTEALIQRQRRHMSEQKKASNGNSEKTKEELEIEVEQLLKRNKELEFKLMAQKKVACLPGGNNKRSNRRAQVAAVTSLMAQGCSFTLAINEIGISKSTYYDNKEISIKHQSDIELLSLITKEYEESNETFGAPRISLALQKKGVKVSQCIVERIMRQNGIKCTKFHHKNRKYKSFKGVVGRIAPNTLNREFDAAKPFEKIVTDITEFKCTDGKLYLSPIIDLYNLEVLSYEVDASPNLSLAIKSLESALQKKYKFNEGNCIIHSDQGWHYQHKSWTTVTSNYDCEISHSRRGNCIDNSLAENFFGILKQEMYYGEPRITKSELKLKISKYIDYYNNKRIKKN